MKKFLSWPLVVIVFLMCFSVRASALSDMKVVDLRSEYLENPVGIDAMHPRLAWKLESKTRGQYQRAYRILVSSSREHLDQHKGDLWDSGIQASAETNQIVYAGADMKSEMRVFWKVAVWDKDNAQSEWSEPAMWSMGLLQQSDWVAQWIGHDAVPENPSQMPVRNFNNDPKAESKFKTYLPAQYLRKEFDLTKKIARATLYVTAQGHVEMHLNGRRVGDEYFTPGWTDYRKRIHYRTHDVTKMLENGSNVVGAILGDGWFRGNISILGQNRYGKNLRLLSQLHVTYADGSEEVIASDPTWKASFGPIVLSDMFEGETYDARKELTGWNAPGFDDASWSAVNTGSLIKPLIEAYPRVPVRRTLELPTVEVTEPKPDTYVFDLSQNFSGWARLKAIGKPGDKITMQFGEMLNADGTVYDVNLRSARAVDHYIMKGKGEEIYEPHFTFHGFRYVQVTGLAGKPNKQTITGIVIHSDAPMTSSFECSNPMLNQLHSNVVWGQRSNYLEVPTDCPQRDERLGWTGDTQVFMRSGAYHQDVAAFFTKWITDLMDTQNKNR